MRRTTLRCATGSLDGRSIFLSLSVCSALISCDISLPFIPPGLDCESPGVCGRSGAVVFVAAGQVNELVSSTGLLFAEVPDQRDMTGAAFGFETNGLRLYATMPSHVGVFDAYSFSRLYSSIEVPNCQVIAHPAALSNGVIAVSCGDSRRIALVDVTRMTPVRFIDCTDESVDAPEIRGLAMLPDGLLVVGGASLVLCDPYGLSSPRRVANTGIAGSETYDDIAVGNDGELYVIGGPRVGVLRFDASTFEFRGILIVTGTGGLGTPSAITIVDDQLVVGDNEGNILMFDRRSGSFLRSLFDGRDTIFPMVDIAIRP